MDVWMDGAPDSTAEPETWLVDGFNALHVAVLRGRDRHAWWRGEERERLLAQVASFEAGEAEVVVVFDGPRPLLSGRPDGAGPRVVFAPSADDWLLRRIKEAAAPDRVALVTADRQLADRARHRGARVVSPRDFLDRCNGTPGSI
jgi:predicted RNA-binding protein with PIN domain